jgi:acetylornithine deacetylase
MKNGLVAGLLAMKAVRDSGVPLAKSVLFTGVVDEEYASIGTEDVAKRYDSDAGLVMDGGSQPCVAHKGFAWVTVETSGKAAHGSNYEDGVDAISMMGRFLARVDALNAVYEQEPEHPLCGRKSIHASLVEGGKELSTYPGYCRARFERRTLPKEDPAGIIDEFNAIIKDLRSQDPRFDAKVTLDFVRHGYEISPTHPLMEALKSAIRENFGVEPTLRGGGGWMDSAVLGAKGIPTAIFGVGGNGAHDLVEWSLLSNITKTARVVADLIVKVCG